MLLTIEEMSFLSKTTYVDEKGKTMAKAGLSDKEKERLAAIDEYHFFTQGVHLMDNYQEVGATEEPCLFYELMTRSQAQFALICEIDKCRTDEERNQLLEKFYEVLSKISKREQTLVDEGWLID